MTLFAAPPSMNPLAGQAVPLDRPPDKIDLRRIAVFAGAIAALFFLIEHDLWISQAANYTQTAEEMEAATAGGDLFRRAGFLALGALGAYWLMTQRASWRVHWPLAATIAVYFGWCYASLLWADDPALCLRRLVVLLCGQLGALGLARACSMRELVLVTVVVTALLAAVGFVAELALGTFRPWSADYRFSGTVHPNTQGMQLAMLALGILTAYRIWPSARGLNRLVLAMPLVLLVLTRSRTSLAAALIAIVVVGFLPKSWPVKLTAAVAGVWLAALAALVVCLAGADPVALFFDLALLGRSEDAESLSGRHLIWPEVWHFIERRPWLGYGYDSFWTAQRIEHFLEEVGWGVREAHNGYLETRLSVGLVGLVLGMAVVMTAAVASARSLLARRDASHGLLLGILLFGLLNANLESAMAWLFLGTFLPGAMVLRMALFDGLQPLSSSLPSAACR